MYVVAKDENRRGAHRRRSYSADVEIVERELEVAVVQNVKPEITMVNIAMVGVSNVEADAHETTGAEEVPYCDDRHTLRQRLATRT